MRFGEETGLADPKLISLVRAALLSGEEFEQAWHALQTHREWLVTEPSVHQLLPLLYVNLRKHDIDDQLLGPLGGVYKRVWLQNQNIYRVLLPAVASLHDHGIDTLLIKGGALIPQFYQDIGLRQISDLDFLVREERFAEAISVLVDEGWSTKQKNSVLDPRFFRGLNLYDRKNFSLDVHAHLLSENRTPGADRVFWEGSVPVEIKGWSFRTLCPADHLLNICVHGTYWNPKPHFRWMADVAVVVASGLNRSDWDRLIGVAEATSVSLPLSQALQFLEEKLALPVPDGVLARISKGSTPPAVRVMYEINQKKNFIGKPLRVLRYRWAFFQRCLGGEERGLSLFLEFLKVWCHVEHLWHVPFSVAAKAMRVLGHRSGLYLYPELRNRPPPAP